MLDLNPDRPAVEPRDAATLLVVRDAPDGVELFCVRRHAKSAFMGGVVVFPGGKVDEADSGSPWGERSDGLHPRASTFAGDCDARALAVCACREALEEAAILPAEPAPDDAATLALRSRLEGRGFAEIIAAADLTLTTARLVPFARWVTPRAEARRYDARFFMTELPAGQRGRHDDHETTSSVWATPARMLDAFMRGDVFLAPPTIRAFELLLGVGSGAEAIALCAAQSLAPICPELVSTDPPTLALPGDRAHSVREPAVAGPTRFVLRDGKFVSEGP